jgi:hypothetical protein
MRPHIKASAAAFAAMMFAEPASAYTNVHIDLSTQTMYVRSSRGNFAWPVSTARAGYVTPRGSYSPKSLQHMHYSRKYHMSPMPHSIFFAGGYAIHGTYEMGSLGRPASHGCVRLSPDHAAQLYELIRSEGGRITITGSRPGGYVSARGGIQRRGDLNYRYSRRRGAQQPDAPFAEIFSDLFSW